jgi:hypothetical protein
MYYGEKIAKKYLEDAHQACLNKSGDISFNMRKYIEKNVSKQSRVWRGRRTYWVCKQHLEQDIEKFLSNVPGLTLHLVG